MKTVQARKFRYGAYIIIANKLGCSSEYVRSVINGRRSNKSDKAQLILKAAQLFLKETEASTTDTKNLQLINTPHLPDEQLRKIKKVL